MARNLGLAVVAVLSFVITVEFAYAATDCHWDDTNTDILFVGSISCTAAATIVYENTEDCKCKATVSTSGSGGGLRVVNNQPYTVGPTYIFTSTTCPSTLTSFTQCGSHSSSVAVKKCSGGCS